MYTILYRTAKTPFFDDGGAINFHQVIFIELGTEGVGRKGRIDQRKFFENRLYIVLVIVIFIVILIKE